MSEWGRVLEPCMYLETLVTIALLLALIATHWMRRRWGIVPFYTLMGAGLFASMSGAIVPSDSLSGIGFSSTVLTGALLVLFLDGPTRFRQTMMGMGMVALITTLIRWSASTLPIPPSLFGPLEDSLRIIGIGSAVFLFKAGLLQGIHRLVQPKRRHLAVLLGLAGLTLSDIIWADRIGMGFSAWSVCLIHFGLSAPLVLWYLNRGWLAALRQPAKPIPPAQLALLKTLEHQLHSDTSAALNELLEAIHQAIPQIEASSLGVRIGERFRVVAQAGHQEEILGVEFSLGNTVIWHGDPQSFERGEARIVGGAAYRERHRLAEGTMDTQTLQRLRRTYWHRSIRSNLGVPILENHSVIAYLNLDSFSSGMAFDQHTVTQLQPYLNALRTIIQAKHQQATRLALQLLSDTVLTLHHTLRNSTNLSEATQQLLDISISAFKAQHGMVSLISEDGFELKGGVARGFFEDLLDMCVPEGLGIGWAALQSGKIIRSNDVKNDLRVFDPRNSQRPNTAQLTVPLFTTKGKPIGVLYLSRNHPRMFDEVEVEIMGAVAEVVSTFLSLLLQQTTPTPPGEPVLS